MLEADFKSSWVVFVTNIDLVRELDLLILLVHGDVDDILGFKSSILKEK